jgi:hypothetical protein
MFETYEYIYKVDVKWLPILECLLLLRNYKDQTAVRGKGICEKEKSTIDKHRNVILY